MQQGTGVHPAATSPRPKLHLGDEAVALPALDLGQVGVGAPVDHDLVQHLHRGLGMAVAPALDLALQPHAQRDVAPQQLHVHQAGVRVRHQVMTVAIVCDRGMRPSWLISGAVVWRSGVDKGRRTVCGMQLAGQCQVSELWGWQRLQACGWMWGLATRASACLAQWLLSKVQMCTGLSMLKQAVQGEQVMAPLRRAAMQAGQYNLACKTGRHEHVCMLACSSSVAASMSRWPADKLCGL